MKSMLHEASSVIKAIEKAWIDSGKPLEFTINIHEMGEKNFFGFTKRPAIVSVTYDPKKQSSKIIEKKETQAVHHKPSKPHPVRQKAEFKPEPGQPKADLGTSKQPHVPKQRVVTPRPELPQTHATQTPEEFWTAELISDIKAWIKEAVALLGEGVPCELSADKRMLKVTFEKSLLPSADDERQLFIGLSYLLLQCLKKKHKKKLRGYHLVISSKHYAATNSASSH